MATCLVRVMLADLLGQKILVLVDERYKGVLVLVAGMIGLLANSSINDVILVLKQGSLSHVSFKLICAV